MRQISLLLLLLGSVAIVRADEAGQAAHLFEKGDFEGAARAARKAVEKAPTDEGSWEVLTRSLVRLDRPDEAWEALEKTALEKNPKSARVRSQLGDVFIKMSEAEQRGGRDGTTIVNYYLDAERMYDAALALDAKFADAIYGKAFVNYNLSSTWKERKEAAAKLLTECLGVDPKHGKAHTLQANMFYADKKYAEAANKFEVGLKLDGSDPIDHVRYGHCFIALGKPDQAKAAYLAGLVRHPENDAAIRSGLYNMGGRDWKTVLPLLDEAAAAAPKSSVTAYWQGYSRQLNGDLGGAGEAFKRAYKIDPGNATYAFWLGYIAEKQGDAQTALGFYRKTLEKSPDYERAATQFEGLCRMQSDIEGAEKLYEELLKLAPRNGWVRNNYGLLLRNWAERRGAAKEKDLPKEVLGRIRRSSEVYEEAAEILTEEAQVQSDAGLLFEYYPAVRDDNKAMTLFTRALELSEYVYRDAFDGLDRLCRRTENWETLKDYADGVIGSIEERGKHAIAPQGASAPKVLKHETPGLLARAKAAFEVASKAK